MSLYDRTRDGNWWVSRRRYAAPAAVFAIGLALRIVAPVALPLGDEAITIDVVRRFGTVELLWMVPTIQPHFPGYYVLLDLWGAAFQLQSSRWLSLLAGAAVPAVAVAWFRHLVGDSRAVFVGLVLAFSPPLVVQSHWLRMYALLTLAVLVSWWAAWAYLRGECPAWQYGLAAAATLSLHPFAVAAVASQLAWLAIEQRRGPWRPGFLSVVGGLVSLSVLLLAPLAGRVAGLFGGYSIDHADLHIRYAVDPLFQAVVLPLATITGTAISWPFIALVVAATGLLAAVVVRQRVWTDRVGRLALCWVGLSLAVLYTAHAVQPVILLKYLLWLAPGVALLLARLVNDRIGAAAVAGLAGVYVPDLVLAVVFGAHIAMVAVWESGVLAPGSL